MEESAAREKRIVKVSLVGIAGNVLLTLFKLAVGFASSSIAIILDAVNSATDALSSVVTIVGTKIAGRRPDRRHPFGYGRLEYLTSVVVAVIIIVAGAISLRESVAKIIWPGTPSYTAVTIAVIVSAVAVKVALAIYFKRAGRAVNSGALIGSGVDAAYDAILSAGTLVVIFAQNTWNLNIDGIVGVIISLFVIKAGLDVLRDSLRPIIGEGEDAEKAEKIREYVESFPDVLGAYDLVIDDFGPGEYFGSVHIEVDDSMTAREIHGLTRKISEGLLARYHILATVGIYAANTTGRFAPMHRCLMEECSRYPAILQVHGFYVDEDTDTVYFDLMIDFAADDAAIVDAVVAAMKSHYPDFDFNVVVDADYEN